MILDQLVPCGDYGDYVWLFGWVVEVLWILGLLLQCRCAAHVFYQLCCVNSFAFSNAAFASLVLWVLKYCFRLIKSSIQQHC
jgi:hypothetical protein